MSETVGAFDAKTHLSEYLERARRGESFVITRRGEPLARLEPVADPRTSLLATLAQCAALRERLVASYGDRRISAEALVREDRDREEPRGYDRTPGDSGDE